MDHSVLEDISALDATVQEYKRESTTIHKSFDLWSARLRDNRVKYSSNQNLVAEQKKRIAMSPQIRGGLEAIQQLEHRKTLGKFETLLEAILEDILPDRQFKVKLNLTVSHKVPSLDFYVATHGTEQWEDAWKNNGGAVADALSLGLRVISILRSGQRPFLLLDEADAWMAIEAMPRYVKVLTQLASEFGLQVLMVTHHPDLLLETEEDVPVYRFTSGSHGEVVSELEPGKSIPLWNDDEKGIRSVRLENVMAHSDTLITLGQGLTVILGKNNVGKSAVANGIIALARGDSDETMIRHHMKDSRVTLQIENGLSIEYRRTRKSEKGYKVFYTLIDKNEEPLKSTNGGTSPPDWVNEYLKLNLTEDMDGLDPFLLTQKDRTFLLNRPKTKRAHVLSIHMGDDVLQSMFKLENKKISELTDEVKAGEKILHFFYRTIECVSKFEDIIGSHKAVDELVSIADEIKELKMLFDQYQRWEKLNAKQKTYERYHDSLSSDVELEDTVLQDLYQSHDNLKACKNWFYGIAKQNLFDSRFVVLNEIDTPDTSYLNEADDLLTKCQKWFHTQKKQTAYENTINSFKDIEIPDISEATTLDPLLEKYGQWKRAVSASEAYAKVNLNEILVPETDFLSEMKNLLDIYSRWYLSKHSTEAYAKFYAREKTIDVPEVLLTPELIDGYQKWQALVVEGKNIDDSIKKEDTVIKDIEREQETIKVCPLCETPLEHGLGGHRHE